MKNILMNLGTVIERTSKRQCILCCKNLDKELGVWHVPLCTKHRMEYFEEIQKEILDKHENDTKNKHNDKT